MRYTDFNVKTHGFAGHMAEPEEGADKAVIVIMGGEKSIFPGIKIAERFAEFGICGLSVSLFGADGLPDGPDRIPLDMFENAVGFLAEKKGINSISTYGVSMGQKMYDRAFPCDLAWKGAAFCQCRFYEIQDDEILS